MVTESEMKELYRKGVKGKADNWESGLIAKTPLTSVNPAMKGLYAEFTRKPRRTSGTRSGLTLYLDSRNTKVN